RLRDGPAGLESSKFADLHAFLALFPDFPAVQARYPGHIGDVLAPPVEPQDGPLVRGQQPLPGRETAQAIRRDVIGARLVGPAPARVVLHQAEGLAADGLDLSGGKLAGAAQEFDLRLPFGRLAVAGTVEPVPGFRPGARVSLDVLGQQDLAIELPQLPPPVGGVAQVGPVVPALDELLAGLDVRAVEVVQLLERLEPVRPTAARIAERS